MSNCDRHEGPKIDSDSRLNSEDSHRDACDRLSLSPEAIFFTSLNCKRKYNDAKSKITIQLVELETM